MFVCVYMYVVIHVVCVCARMIVYTSNVIWITKQSVVSKCNNGNEI